MREEETVLEVNRAKAAGSSLKKLNPFFSRLTPPHRGRGRYRLPGVDWPNVSLAENGFLEDSLVWSQNSRGETKPYLLLSIPSSRRENNCAHASPTLL